MPFGRRVMSGESVIDGHQESVQLRVNIVMNSVTNLWVRRLFSLLNQTVRLRVIQGGLVGPAENNTYNDAGISTGFERGTLKFSLITTMNLRTSSELSRP